MTELLEKAHVYLIQFGMNFVVALVIFIIGRWAAKIVSNITEQALLKAKVEKTLARFGKNVVYFTILTFVCIAALNKIGIETNSFLAVIGAAGLAVGLALQGSLSNFASGVMMIIFHPFAVEDYIEAGGAEGVVHEIQIFNTIIHTKDGKKVIVPNSKITGDKIVVHPRS